MSVNNKNLCYKEEIKNELKFKYYKDKIEKAKIDRKIFTVNGKYMNALRMSLKSYGWLEKYPIGYSSVEYLPYHILLKNLEIGNKYESALISKLLANVKANFLWSHTNWKSLNNFQNGIVNYIPFAINKFNFCTKSGLANCVTSESHWWNVDNFSELKIPRGYCLFHFDNNNNDEDAFFLNDFLLTSCFNLLKFISNNDNCVRCRVDDANNDEIKLLFDVNGTISLNWIHFASNRIRENIFVKQNKDIDFGGIYNPENINKLNWESFLTIYYNVIRNNDRFKIDKEHVADECKNLIQMCRNLLIFSEQYWPDIRYDGYLNLWLLKPTLGSCGYGIQIMDKYLDIVQYIKNKKHLNNGFIVQKYIERPLLIHNTKFDIRQYFLITRDNIKLQIWMYKNVYLKFSSLPFNIKEFNQIIHLTNYTIQRKHPNVMNPSKEIPAYKMWNLKTFQNYLNKLKDHNYKNIWTDKIYPDMKKCIIALILCSIGLDTISLVNTNNNYYYQLFGADFMITYDYNVRLIEINSRPDLENSTPITSVICAEVLEDLVKVIFGNKTSKPNQFECIHQISHKITNNDFKLEIIGKNEPFKEKI